MLGKAIGVTKHDKTTQRKPLEPGLRRDDDFKGSASSAGVPAQA